MSQPPKTNRTIPKLNRSQSTHQNVMVASASLDRIFRRPKVQRAVNQWAASAERESQDPTSSRSGQFLLAMNSAEPDQQCKRGCADFVNLQLEYICRGIQLDTPIFAKVCLDLDLASLSPVNGLCAILDPPPVQQSAFVLKFRKTGTYTCHWLPQIYSELISVK
ncbi:Hypothetical_protein [Hexamita inflata]|uniref:Hypothetical_protein n=1 Tax=Hexamita inflata TaxID=28002 RepID=A0AA86U3A1_9EUKA|nr:Hypothetical protein HINF_LOCUS17073 [Hexamita inflata]